MNDRDLQIEEYLLGRLKGQDLAAFHKKQEQDPAFAKLVKEEQTLVDGIRDYSNQQLKNRIGNLRQQMLEEDKVKYLPLYRRSWVRLAIAASVVLLVSVIGWQLYLSPSSLGEKYFSDNFYPVYNVPLALRDSKIISVDEIEIIKENFLKHKFDEVIPDMLRYRHAFPDNQYARLILIISYIGEDRLAEAKAEFKMIDPPGELTDAVNWYRAMLHLKEGKLDEAAASLELVIADRGSDFREVAKELYQEIENNR